MGSKLNELDTYKKEGTLQNVTSKKTKTNTIKKNFRSAIKKAWNELFQKTRLNAE